MKRVYSDLKSNAILILLFRLQQKIKKTSGTDLKKEVGIMAIFVAQLPGYDAYVS